MSEYKNITILHIVLYCDMHAVGQQSTVETLFITVAKQRNNGSDQRFLWGLTPACTQQSKELLFSTGSVLRQQQPMQQWVFSLWSVHGLYSRAATGTRVS
jgi:hypothetical protein